MHELVIKSVVTFNNKAAIRHEFILGWFTLPEFDIIIWGILKSIQRNDCQ